MFAARWIIASSSEQSCLQCHHHVLADSTSTHQECCTYLKILTKRIMSNQNLETGVIGLSRWIPSSGFAFVGYDY